VRKARIIRKECAKLDTVVWFGVFNVAARSQRRLLSPDQRSGQT
jgi:hypothetical protein